MVRITVRGKNVEVTDALHDYVAKRVSKLEKYFGSIEKAIITLSIEKDRHVVEVTIPLNGIILRGEEETEDMYASIDLVIAKLEKQIAKHKTRLSRKLKNQTLREPLILEPEITEEEVKIVRSKRFNLKPMPVEEAVMQMNLLGHSFFVFRNAETEEVNVVYRRKNGDYGLIEPAV